MIFAYEMAFMMTKTPKGAARALFTTAGTKGAGLIQSINRKDARKSWRASMIPCWDSSGKLESPYITVHQGGVRLFITVTPTACAAPKSCASGCISYDRRVLTVSPEKCIGCGFMRHGVPHLRPGGPPPERCGPHGGGPRIACGQRGAQPISVAASFLEQAREPDMKKKIVRVECLGRVDESLLADLAVEGAREVVLIHGDCNAAITGGVAPAPRRWWKPPEKLLGNLGARP